MVEEAYNETAAVPLLWLRVDPSLEWACRVAWSGRPREPLWSGMPEGMVRDQLQLDRCVASQLDAVAALTTFPTLTAINTLEVALRDDEVFYRVRAAAAAALCALVAPATNYEALHRLIKYARERLYDDGAVRPNDFTDLGEYFVTKAVIEAIGGAQTAEGTTPPKSLDLLHELLDENCNEGNEYDDSHYVAALLRALGSTRPASAAAASRAAAQIRRHVHLDRLRRSHARVLTRSALQALVTLELGGLAAPSWALYEEHAARGAGAAERLAASDCLLRLVLLLPESVQRPAGCESTLLVALRHSHLRRAAPLEQLRLWRAYAALLRDADAPSAQPEAVERERAAFRKPPDALLPTKAPRAAAAPEAAAVHLLWEMMVRGAAGRPRLRFALAEVWRCLLDPKIDDGAAAQGRPARARA